MTKWPVLAKNGQIIIKIFTKIGFIGSKNLVPAPNFKRIPCSSLFHNLIARYDNLNSEF